MKSSKKVLALALAAAMVVTAVPTTNASAATTGVAKSKTYYAGKSYTLTLTTPKSWKSVKTTWTSSKKSVAKVAKKSTKKAKVTAVKAGTANVKVKVTYAKSTKKNAKKYTKTYTCKVTVKNPSLKLSGATEVTTGSTAALTVAVKPASAKVTYASSDAAVATVDANGVVTGVKAGTATITATAKVGTKTLTATQDVTVKDAEAQLTGVKQTASNAVTATFSADASKVTKDDIKVVAADGSSELAVKSVEVSADKLTANVTVYNNFSDAKEYNVTYKNATQSFTASVGEVTGVTVTTTEAQLNVKTAIKYVLTDANGIDVTPSVDQKAKCNITVEGNYSTAEVGDASDAYITMTNEGDVAKVTVSYDNGAKDFTPVTGSGEIKCVKAQAIKADALFTTSTDTNTKSGCAKFYLGLSDKTASVAESKDTTIYFCAKDENGDVVSYDKYDVQSANEDVASATVDSTADNGKYAKLTVHGNIVGSTSLTVTTSKNGAVKTYVIPVTVTKKGIAVKMTVDVSETSMSNAIDKDYNSQITAKLLDAAGDPVDNADFTYEITNNSTTSPAAITTKGKFTAFNGTTPAAAKTYTVKVTGSDNATSTTFTRNISIKVSALPEKVYTEGASMTYAVKIDKKSLDENSKDRTSTAKLYATCNGLFAGYVRGAANNIEIGEARDDGNYATADANTKLKSVKVAAKYGTLAFSKGNLVQANAKSGASISDAWEAYTDTTDAAFNCVDTSGTVIYKANDYTTLAKTGTYTVEFRMVYDKASKNTNGTGNDKYASATNTFTVTNTVKVPTVTVVSRNSDSVSYADYVKCLKTDVDMNNNTSDYESIKEDTTTANNATLSGSGNTKVTVKNVIVEDTRVNANETWNFYVPINTTFTQK